MPEPDPKPAAEGLQFDKAEVAPALKCSVCRAEINDVYYKLAAKVICDACNEKVKAPAGGSGTARFIKAVVLGAIAAAIGSGIYYGILAATGYQIALISILVGIMVGAAVNFGSEKRGGLVYQLLAVFLTYTSIVAAYVPLIIEAGAKRSAQRPHPKAAAAAPADEAERAADAADADAGKKLDPAEKPPAPAAPKMSKFELIVLVIGAIYAIPFQADNIIGLFIIGVGLYQAFKINKKPVLNIRGPFQRKAAAGSAAGG